MKRTKAIFMGLLFSATCMAQNEVSWNYTTKKIDAKTYEVHITANLQKPWHIYSQSTPDGGPVATKIVFAKNPLLTLNGKAKEVGKLVTEHEKTFDIDVKYYEGKVEFVQTVKLKNLVKTNINGSVTYMLCKDGQCITPRTNNFSLKLE
jgi:hypothetical protein